MTVADALSALSSLTQTINALLPEVAWMAPEQVRLQLTSWIAQARSLQAATLHADKVVREVRALAGLLGGVSKRWWPGNVSALQLHTQPRQAAMKFGLKLSGPPTWDAVAECIEVILEDEEDGWADGGCLEPRPLGVDDAFYRLICDLEALLGPLRDKANDAVLDRMGDPAAGKALVEWAMRLRWMRGVAPSGDRWATAMGRLRWAAQRSPEARRHLAVWLDPSTVPREGSWAKALGEDPEKRVRERQLREVLRAAPGAGASPQRVTTWLAEALLIGRDLSTRQLAGLLSEHTELVLGLGHADLGEVERRVRTRLPKLQALMQEPEPAAPPPPVLPEPGPEGPDDPVVDPVSELITAVRARVAGQSAVFVSNRKDPALKTKLEEKLGLTIDWCDGSRRRVQSVAKQIDQGTYDLVILATGFSGHVTDVLLGKAASRAGVPFVRAYKGRSLATLRALARDLGIRQEGA
jgi:hypothetical protein